ncbi:hypothetical protein ZHAS_00012826 [Anopheles sinensis]|uniref:Uncharacterized protein n=1 Tax=Anopheles sinensis TaxID=74873 RepID=A0A084W3W9_ANOSI|nr:hypothetical protein ZHAS_00012826 [Anopheles sinensis]
MCRINYNTERRRSSTLQEEMTLACAWLLGVGGVGGSGKERDDVTVEEMLRRESRDTRQEQQPFGRQLTDEESGVDAEEVHVGHSVRHRQTARTRQPWRGPHRTRHAGRQGKRKRAIWKSSDLAAASASGNAPMLLVFVASRKALVPALKAFLDVPPLPVGRCDKETHKSTTRITIPRGPRGSDVATKGKGTHAVECAASCCLGAPGPAGRGSFCFASRTKDCFKSDSNIRSSI